MIVIAALFLLIMLRYRTALRFFMISHLRSNQASASALVRQFLRPYFLLDLTLLAVSVGRTGSGKVSNSP